jgi:hypothetical protein
MRTHFVKSIAIAATLAVAGLTSAYAEEVTYTAKLTGAAETPPNTTPGTGTVAAKFDTTSKLLSWTVEYSGLTGPAAAAHFHGPAPEGKAAGVLVPIKGSLDSPIKGSETLTDDQAKDLTDGMIYFNIHTAANKAGEIRGQLTKGM